jgi:hypothetical protein
MRSADRHGPRRWLLSPFAVLVLVLVLVLSGLAAGCGSSKPAYCTAGSQLKTSVRNLGDVNVAENGLGSLQTALSKVQASAKTFADDAKSAFPSQTTALKNSLSGLQTAIKSATGQPPLTAAAAVASSVTQVKNSASTLQSAASGKCS